MTGLYSLRRLDRSVQLGAVLFLLVLGYGYIFAFLMVKHWAGLTPADVAATYVPPQAPGQQATSQSQTQPIDLSKLTEEKHTVDVPLLIQDSHIHILKFDVIAALQQLIVLGLEWRPWWRNSVITAGFAAGALDFSGQWLMEFGAGGFAYLTIAAGWLMTAVYVVVLVGTLRAVFGRKAPERSNA